MDIHDIWTKALKNTEIVRSRVQGLMTFKDTAVPYIFLAESSINDGDTVVRKGQVMVEKPSIILPPNVPQFEGFEFDPDSEARENNFINFLLVRGVHVPSFRYNNQTSLLDVYEGGMSKAIDYYQDQLQRMEDVHTGLIAGLEDCWQFSLLIYSCAQIARNADLDVRRLLEEYKKKQ